MVCTKSIYRWCISTYRWCQYIDGVIVVFWWPFSFLAILKAVFKGGTVGGCLKAGIFTALYYGGFFVSFFMVFYSFIFISDKIKHNTSIKPEEINQQKPGGTVPAAAATFKSHIKHNKIITKPLDCIF